MSDGDLLILFTVYLISFLFLFFLSNNKISDGYLYDASASGCGFSLLFVSAGYCRGTWACPI